MKRLKGFTLIELLIVVAIIAILAAIAVPNFLEAQTRAKVSRVRSDQRTLATALEAYYIDNNSYPAFDDASVTNGGPNPMSRQLYPASFPRGVAQALNTTTLDELPSFRVKTESTNAYDNLMTLTTPVSYITSYFGDPFADTPGATFCYCTPATAGNLSPPGWILVSFGPDKDESAGGDTILVSNKVTMAGNVQLTVIEETVYSAFRSAPTDVLITRAYDPTNGTTSNGDVYRFKQ